MFLFLLASGEEEEGSVPHTSHYLPSSSLSRSLCLSLTLKKSKDTAVLRLGMR
jgi:hypothetical protein